MTDGERLQLMESALGRRHPHAARAFANIMPTMRPDHTMDLLRYFDGLVAGRASVTDDRYVPSQALDHGGQDESASSLDASSIFAKRAREAAQFGGDR